MEDRDVKLRSSFCVAPPLVLDVYYAVPDCLWSIFVGRGLSARDRGAFYLAGLGMMVHCILGAYYRILENLGKQFRNLQKK